MSELSSGERLIRIVAYVTWATAALYIATAGSIAAMFEIGPEPLPMLLRFGFAFVVAPGFNALVFYQLLPRLARRRREVSSW